MNTAKLRRRNPTGSAPPLAAVRLADAPASRVLRELAAIATANSVAPLVWRKQCHGRLGRLIVLVLLRC